MELITMRLFLLTLLLHFVASLAVAPPEETRTLGAVSEVRITVGESPNFIYEVYGYTFSKERITVSGDYFNNEFTGKGYVNLFLGVTPSIYYFEFQPNYQDSRRLNVLILNQFEDEFYYEVIVPEGVSVLRQDIVGYQWNATALIVKGPSRSQVWYPRSSPLTGKVK